MNVFPMRLPVHDRISLSGVPFTYCDSFLVKIEIIITLFPGRCHWNFFRPQERAALLEIEQVQHFLPLHPAVIDTFKHGIIHKFPDGRIIGRKEPPFFPGAEYFIAV